MGDLGFDIHLGGRAPKAVSAEIIRELTQADLALLATERHIQPSHVQRLTSRHHALARCLATGMSAGEAALCTGYTPSRISVMKGDPAFEELCTFYRSGRSDQVQDLGEKLLSVAHDAATILQERLEDEPEKFNVDALNEIVKLGADRTGFGPKATQVNVNVNLGDRMKSARERAASGVLPGAIRQLGAGEAGHAAKPAPLLEGEVLK